MNGRQGGFGCDQNNALGRGVCDISRMGGRTRGVVLSVSGGNVGAKIESTTGLPSIDLREREH